MDFQSFNFFVESQEPFQMIDLSNQVKEFLQQSGFQQGFVVVMSQHTTTALAINEMEERLVEDVKTYFSALVPANKKYLHNDIHLRDCPPDEPENAHAHIISMMLSQTETIAIIDGKLSLGEYQSVILFELDGPRKRNIRLQYFGC